MDKGSDAGLSFVPVRPPTWIVVLFAGILAFHFSTPVIAQDLRCGTSTIRLVCDGKEGPFCVASHAEVIMGNGQAGIITTPRYLDPALIPAAAGCAQGDGGDYLVVTFTTGGSCPECEKWGLFSIDGTEITKGGGDFDAVARRLRISKPDERRTVYLPEP